MKLLVGILALAAATVAVVPHGNKAQTRYQTGGIVALTHFNMATFYHDGDPACNAGNWNGANGSEHPASFAPAKLDVANWIASYKALGAKSAVLTAKHGCGFLLWPTKTTLPSGEAFGYHTFGPGGIQRDVVGEFAAECAKANLGHGFYYSFKDSFYMNALSGHVLGGNVLPGQLNMTQAQFEEIILAQVKELWGNYGNFTEIWFDGGVIPELHDRVRDMLSTLQPSAAAFGGFGASANPVCWVGTELGNTPTHIWAQGSAEGPGDPTSPDYCPKGCDTTLQEGDHWFYVPGTPIRSLAELISVYHHTVGNGGTMEMDFAINRDGLVEPSHAARYKEFGDWIRSCYDFPLGETNGTGPVVELWFDQPTEIDRVAMKEDLRLGESVRSFTVTYQTSGSSDWLAFDTASPLTGIGSLAIVLNATPVRVSALRLTLTSQNSPTYITSFAAFKECPSA